MQKVVDAQQVRPEDVDRMNTDKEALLRQIETVQAKSESVAKVVWENEITLQKRMDHLEKLVQDYNQMAFRLNLLDPSSPNAEGVRFELELNIHAARVEDAINLDLRGRIRVRFLAISPKLIAIAIACSVTFTVQQSCPQDDRRRNCFAREAGCLVGTSYGKD